MTKQDISSVFDNKVILSIIKWAGPFIVIIGTFISLIGWASNKSSKLDQIEKDLNQTRIVELTETKSEIKEINKTNNKQDQDITEIKSDIKYIIKLLEKK